MQIKIVKEKPQDKKLTEVVLNHKIAQDRLCSRNGRKILEIKTPEPKKMNLRKWIVLVRKIIRTAKVNREEKLLLSWSELTKHLSEKNEKHLGILFSEALEMANYDFQRYKSKPKEGWPLVKSVAISLEGWSGQARSLQVGLRRGQTVAQMVNYARELANISGSDLTPTKLVTEIRKAIKEMPIKLQVWGEKEMKKRKMNGILTVGQGSKEESKFIILKYLVGNKKEKPIVLVGKGVTFDSGGLDTKPHPHALDMMMDMSGAASVLATLLALTKLKIKRNVIVLIPAVENMPSGSSMRPGDVIKMSNGLSVEIGHTDAEGRLILAEALIYAQKLKPKTVIDVATLTGASLVALGTKASALMTRNEELAEKIRKMSEFTGDYVWELPLWEEYEQDIIGERGDIANINTKAKPGEGSTITAGIFLWNFIKDCSSWAHLDIAPRMIAGPREQLAKGAAAPAVRLLTELISQNEI